MDKKNILSFTKPKLDEYIWEHLDQSPFRSTQLFDWIYKKRCLDFDKMSNMSIDFRKKLNEFFYFGSLEIELKKESQFHDAAKFVFKLQDDNRVESVCVLTPERKTICLSTQVGCKYKCAFCLSGRKGFFRDLEAGEIVGQIMGVIIDLKIERPDNIVYMGMGEPFDNYREVIKSIKIVNDKNGLNIGARRITISTCGLVDGIRKLSRENIQVELAVSLHAATDEKRDYILPINRKHNLKELMKVCRDYVKDTGRIITFEYVLIKGFNDSVEDINSLTRLLKDLPSKVNVIKYNASPGSEYKSTSRNEIFYFTEKLKKKGINATIRFSKGEDISAACGQLG